MNKSESIKNLAAALATFHQHVGKVSKDASNPFFKSKYASLPNILEAIAGPLEQSGIVFSQFPTDNNGLSTIIIHAESGEWMESTYVMPVAKQNDPQAVGSAITYARRYALSSAFGLNVDDDDDGNAAAKKPEAQKQEPKKEETLLIQFTVDIAKEVDACLTRQDMDTLWKKYPELRKNPEFAQAVKDKTAWIDQKDLQR